jgi:hypothetical protein
MLNSNPTESNFLMGQCGPVLKDRRQKGQMSSSYKGTLIIFSFGDRFLCYLVRTSGRLCLGRTVFLTGCLWLFKFSCYLRTRIYIYSNTVSMKTHTNYENISESRLRLQAEFLLILKDVENTNYLTKTVSKSRWYLRKLVSESH